ncbi:MAG TPA: DUF222 domain-containing protein [Jatrophihabitans sp.]|jgi:hypothetical protein|uniref:HNH endonuclease signature motif containing protein n=1 Tax=Jatrophihabitans sp. TaxID=1932789 RepID=UPI002DF74FC9|nr:DUF222 domain-containing protein [Jatrophihabitans sp.]
MDGAGMHERDALLDRLLSFQKVHAALHAEEQRMLARLAALPLPPCLDTHDKQYVVDEVAAVLRLSGLTASDRVATAQDLVGRYPATLDALSRGELTLDHARVLSDEALGLDDATAALVEARVLQRAGGKTPVQFRACAHRAVASLDQRPPEVKPDPREERRVCPRYRKDGMGELWALLPAEDLATLMNTITQLARATQGMDERTAEQRRADALADLGRGDLHPTAGPAVEVIVSLSTLLGMDEQAGELKGVGPVPAEVARRLADDPTGTWRRLLTDPAGQVLETSPTYAPPAAMARFVKDRDTTCRFPGCRASRTEIDHIVPWLAGGPTHPDNLHLLCPRHHHLKHEAGWSVHRTLDGVTHWTSPTGRHFDKPPDELPVDTTCADLDVPAPF